MRVQERRDRIASGDVFVTVPEQSGRRPALLYLPALGTTTLVCDFEAHALGVLLSRLTATGFVTLRAEPRVGASLEDMLVAHRASHSFLLSLPEVDPERVFLFGHSLGGTLAPHVAARARGIVTYGAPSRSWSECMARSALRQLELFGLTGEELAREAELAARLYREVFEGGMEPADLMSSDPAIRASRAATDVRENTLFNRAPDFDRALQRLDLEKAWKMTANVLAVSGAHDWVVDSDDHRRIAGWAERGVALTLPGLDHWMQRHPSRASSYQNPGRGVIDPNWAEPVLEWLREEST
jgi:hypothetical protein